MDPRLGKADRMTVDEFLDAFASEDRRYELVDGIPVLLPKVNARQSRVRGNLLAGLYRRLEGGPCEVFGTNMALKIGEHDLRLPAATIYCDQAEMALANDKQRYLSQPRVVFETLPPATASLDWLNRLIEYQRICSIDTIVEIDTDRRSFTTYVRAAGSAWTTVTQTFDAPICLRNPELVLTADEIFHRVKASMANPQAGDG